MLENVLESAFSGKTKRPEMFPFQAFLNRFHDFPVVEIRRIELLTS